MKRILLLTCCLATFLLYAPNSIGQSDALYSKAYAAYSKGNWKDAMNLLFAFLNFKPTPSKFSDPAYVQSVNNAYNYARTSYYRDLQTPPPSQSDGESSVSADLSAPAPALPQPPAVIMHPLHIVNVVDGSWILHIIKPNQNDLSCNLVLNQSGKSINGTLTIISGTDIPIVGEYDSGVLVFTGIADGETQLYTMTTSDSKDFSGTYKYEGSYTENGAIHMSKQRQMNPTLHPVGR